MTLRQPSQTFVGEHGLVGGDGFLCAAADRLDLPTEAARLRGDVVLVLDGHVLVISVLEMDDADAAEVVAGAS